MKLLAILPSPDLQDWIERYSLIELKTFQTEQISPAWAKDFLIFHYGGGVSASFDDGTILPNWKSSIDGMTTRPYTWKLDKGSEIKFIAAHLRPGVLHHLIKSASSELINQSFEIEEINPTLPSSWVTDALSATTSDIKKITFLETYLRNLFKTLPRVSYTGKVQEIIFRIKNDKGKTDLYELRKQMNVSERHFRRIFSESIGLSPKTYTRLIRNEYALKALYQLNEKHLTEVALSLDYFDQSHFIKDFKSNNILLPKHACNNPELRSVMETVYAEKLIQLPL